MSRFVDKLIATATATGPQRGMITGAPDDPQRRTWAQVHQRARAVAGSLTTAGMEPGSAVAVLAAAPELIAPGVQGVWLAGGSVTMLHQPTARTDLAAWAEDTVRVLGMVGARLVLLGEPFEDLAPVLSEHGIDYRMIESLLDGASITEPAPTGAGDTALLQLTSGSTAEPKAVRITHANLISNVTAMIERAELNPAEDVMVSWLPTFHDMGMVGFLTVPMTFGVELVKVTPAAFMERPLIWPELISRYGGVATAAPNFAYAIVGKRMAGVAEDDAYDLSSLRIALNGAEPIDESAVAGFVEAGARFGMSEGAVFPAYGMAEATLAVSFAPVLQGLDVDVVEAKALESDNRAVPVDAEDPRRGTEDVRSFAKLGRPLDGLEAGISDQHGTMLAEREVGEIQLRGEAVTPGYLTMHGPVATQDEHGWMASGDLGYLVDGQVVICGRIKDVIIMGGRNIYPTDIERAAGSVRGVRPGNAVAVRIDAGTRRERFAVILESGIAGDDEAEAALVREVTARVRDAVQLRPYSVVVLSPGNLPKTPSGKVKRATTADQYAEHIGTRSE